MPKFNKHIIVVGSARSGTSWLAELLARPYRYRLLFEPEHEFQTKKGGLLCDRYIRTKAEAGKGHAYLKKVFRNWVDSDWIAQHSNRKWKRHLWPFVPKRFVIKFVRCNLAAKYMNEEFGIPVLHVVRDPYEVIASQQRVNFPWLFDLSYFKLQPGLVEFVKDNYQFDLLNTEELSNTEILALRWCLENPVALALQKPLGPSYKIIDYAKLRRDSTIFQGLCKEFNFQVVQGLETLYHQPSSKTHPKSSFRETTINLDKEIGKERSVEKFLAIFGNPLDQEIEFV